MDHTRPTTTAQARAWAYEAAARFDWAEAARLYREALRLYPELPGDMARDDRAQLARLALHYEYFAAADAALKPTCTPATSAAPLERGDQRSIEGPAHPLCL